MTKLLTKYGVVEENNKLDENLDYEIFLQWTKDYKLTHKDYPSNNDEWIVLYKKMLAEEFASRYFNIAEKF